ncbi:MAG: aminotransferase class I/II-fold pyridoxal phosphate-dependent enzyme [Myxococcales bacterium]|nr:aminotransferase class I/II-fold pyridoxal phosphate-dependent enzyme [Myxococcales bacterium]
MSDAWIASGLSPMAAQLKGSSILVIAGQVRELIASGRDVCNLTIGDFNPSEFPVPTILRDGIKSALDDSQTNYPPSNGLPALREAVSAMYQRKLGIDIDPAHVTVCSGARPLLYACYRAVVSPGDKVVYAAPSWNNNHYASMLGANVVQIKVGPEDNFFPRADQFAEHLKDARLFVLNSPLNPSGTLIRPEVLKELCQSIVAENDRRKEAGEKPLFLLYDQIYWMLTLGDVPHADPIGVEPRMKDYAIYVDGISKAFAATGLRIGFGISPAPICKAMNRVLGHVGAWAPRPGQLGTIALLNNPEEMEDYLTWIRGAAKERLELIHQRMTALAADYPVRALEPEGAIYLSVELALTGYETGGKGDGPLISLNTPDDVRRYLLDAAGVAVVPFIAFGAGHAPDWYRLSVGSVSVAQLSAALDRIETAVRALRPAA